MEKTRLPSKRTPWWSGEMLRRLVELFLSYLLASGMAVGFIGVAFQEGVEMLDPGWILRAPVCGVAALWMLGYLSTVAMPGSLLFPIVLAPMGKIVWCFLRGRESRRSHYLTLHTIAWFLVGSLGALLPLGATV